MNKLVVIIAVALLVAGCSSKNTTAQNSNSSGDLAISSTFTPDPPKQGLETLTITVKDASGSPVKGAAVKVSTSMPSMSMGGPTANGTDNGDGTYTATLPLQYSTSWQFTIAASASGRSGRTTVTADVK